MQIVFLLIAALTSVECFALAQQDRLSPAELASRALVEKERGDAVAYIHLAHKAAKAGIDAMRSGELEFTTIAPWVAEALTLPAGPMEYAESTETVLLGCQSIIKDLLTSTIGSGDARSEEFAKARRSVAAAALQYLNGVQKAALQDTVEKTETELKAAIQAYKTLPKEILSLPENANRYSGQNPDEFVNPDLRRTFQRTKNAQRAVLYARSGQKAAFEILPKLIPEITELFRKLYGQGSAMPGEVDELLHKHGLDNGPLGDAISGK